ncbi:g4858 [Coccomyxa elongata]
MRRMELAADLLYKQKLARGFLHLADGQEAVPTGMEAALTFQDSIIQSYRDHCTFLGRGGTVKEVIAELLGKQTGAARGLGGSMHLYKREHNFFGGEGIVGTHVPLGAGLGFAHKYRNDGHVAFALYGDGAANQGQAAEAYNMAAIWELPVVFVIENNHYGMGTADRRAAKSAQYYTRGDYIPGVWVDGMDALSVKSATAFAKQYVLQHGPLMLEMDTYRYHGHSISDPGSTYRTRDEIQGIRRARDPIEHVRTLLQEHGFADAQELKRIEKEVKKDVSDQIEEAKQDAQPPIENLWLNIYKDGLGAKMRPMEMGRPKIQLPEGITSAK